MAARTLRTRVDRAIERLVTSARPRLIDYDETYDELLARLEDREDGEPVGATDVDQLSTMLEQDIARIEQQRFVSYENQRYSAPARQDARNDESNSSAANMGVYPAARERHPRARTGTD